MEYNLLAVLKARDAGFSVGIRRAQKEAERLEKGIGDIKKDANLQMKIGVEGLAKIERLKGAMEAARNRAANPLNVRLRDEATNRLNKLRDQLNRLTGKAHEIIANVKVNGAEKLNKLKSNLSESFNGAAMAAGSSMLGLGAAGGLTYGAVNALQSQMSFEKEMSSVKAILSGTYSGAELEARLSELTQSAETQAMRTKFTAAETAKALYYMGMAGWKTEQMQAALPSVLNLAAAGDADLATTSDILTDSMTAFGLKAGNVVKGREVSQSFADLMGALVTNANTDIPLLGETMKYAAANVGALYANGTDEQKLQGAQDMMMLAGLAANAGIKGSQSGTGIRAILTRMAAQNRNAYFGQEFLGVKMEGADGEARRLRDIFSDFRKKFRDGMDVDQLLEFGEMLEGTKIHADTRRKLEDALKSAQAHGGKMTGMEMNKIAAMLSGQEAMTTFLSAMTASEEDWAKLNTALENSAGSVERMANIRLDNLSGDITLLASAWDYFQRSIVKDSTQGGLRDFTQALTDMLSRANSSIEKSGFTFTTLFDLAADGISRLKNKFLELDGVGSILAGGVLMAGLTKIIKTALKLKDSISSLMKIRTMTDVGNVLRESNKTVATMNIKAGVVNINGAVNRGGGVNGGVTGTSARGTPPTNAGTTARGTPPAGIPPASSGKLATFGKGAALAAIFSALDIYATSRQSEYNEGVAAAQLQEETEALKYLRSNGGTSEQIKAQMAAVRSAEDNLTAVKKENAQSERRTNASAVGSVIGAGVGMFAGPVGSLIGGLIGGAILPPALEAIESLTKQKSALENDEQRRAIAAKKLQTEYMSAAEYEARQNNEAEQLKRAERLKKATIAQDYNSTFAQYQAAAVKPTKINAAEYAQKRTEYMSAAEYAQKQPIIAQDYNSTFAQYQAAAVKPTKINAAEYAQKRTEYMSAAEYAQKQPIIAQDYNSTFAQYQAVQPTLPDNRAAGESFKAEMASAFESVSNFAESLSSSFSGGFESVTAGIGGFIESLSTSFSGGFESVTAGIGGFIESLSTSFNGGFENVTTGISGFIESLSTSFNGGFESVTAGISNFIESLNSSFSGGFESVTAGISGFIESLSTSFNGGFENVTTGISGFIESLSSSFSGGFESVTAGVGGFIESLSSSFSGGFESVLTMAAGSFDNLTATITGGAEMAHMTITTAFSSAAAEVQGIWGAVPAFFGGIFGGLGAIASAAGSAIAAGVNSGIGLIQSAWESLSGWLSSKISALSAMASSAASIVIGANYSGTANWRGGLTTVNEHGGELINLPNGDTIYPYQTLTEIAHNAAGTSNFAGGWSEVNEHGGELMYLPQGTRIIPHATTVRLLREEIKERLNERERIGNRDGAAFAKESSRSENAIVAGFFNSSEREQSTARAAENVRTHKDFTSQIGSAWIGRFGNSELRSERNESEQNDKAIARRLYDKSHGAIDIERLRERIGALAGSEPALGGGIGTNIDAHRSIGTRINLQKSARGDALIQNNKIGRTGVSIGKTEIRASSFKSMERNGAPVNAFYDESHRSANDNRTSLTGIFSSLNSGVSNLLNGGSSNLFNGGVSTLFNGGVSTLFNGGVSTLFNSGVSTLFNGGSSNLFNGGSSTLLNGGISTLLNGGVSNLFNGDNFNTESALPMIGGELQVKMPEAKAPGGNTDNSRRNSATINFGGVNITGGADFDEFVHRLATLFEQSSVNFGD